jgi:mannose-6-phosphate isomerase-like protein (cupin superfamily)
MQNFCLVDFGPDEQQGYLLGSRVPEDSPAYSQYLDIGYNQVSKPWRDEAPHYHSVSEEYFVVLQGQIDMLVEGEIVQVKPRELLAMRSEVTHQVIGGSAPIENFLFRVPGGGKDKVLAPAGEPGGRATGQGSKPVLLDIHQRFSEYPLGACLPETHPFFSPLLDFTCVWGVDPALEWAQEQLHVHSVREEYYILLRGSLDFAIGTATVSVRAGQIFGVRPGAVHKVLGGNGPVDLLFVRVPGGRGDKIVCTPPGFA